MPLHEGWKNMEVSKIHPQVVDTTCDKQWMENNVVTLGVQAFQVDSIVLHNAKNDRKKNKLLVSDYKCKGKICQNK